MQVAMVLTECGGLGEDAFSGFGIFVRMKMVVDLILGDGDWQCVWWLDHGFMAQVHVSQRLGVWVTVVFLPKWFYVGNGGNWFSQSFSIIYLCNLGHGGSRWHGGWWCINGERGVGCCYSGGWVLCMMAVWMGFTMVAAWTLADDLVWVFEEADYFLHDWQLNLIHLVQFLEFSLPFSFLTFWFDNGTPQSQNQLVIRESGSFTVVYKVGIWIIWLGLVWYLWVGRVVEQL